ncbi:MAG: CvpA family protein [Pseudomonadota bacterium]
MVDGIILGLIGVSAVFGLIRGIVSQIMGILGLVAAYLLAPGWGRLAAGFVQGQLGCSKFMAEKVSIFFVGVAIYLACRLIGYGIEKAVVGRVKAFRTVNRLGGAIFGALKTAAILAIVLCFLALIPSEQVRGWFPKLPESRAFQLAAKHNPMGKQAMLERMRRLRTTMIDPKQAERLARSDQIEKILSQYDLKGALDEKKFVEAVRTGDFDELAKNEKVEALMKDDRLTELLDQLVKEPAPASKPK